MIHFKSEREIEVMKKAGRITANILQEVARAVKPGISTLELDKMAETLCGQYKVKPAFKGYQNYPESIYINTNEQIVHGIPSAKKILKEGY